MALCAPGWRFCIWSLCSPFCLKKNVALGVFPVAWCWPEACKLCSCRRGLQSQSTWRSRGRKQGCWYQAPVCVSSRRSRLIMFDPESSPYKSIGLWSEAWVQEGSRTYPKCLRKYTGPGRCVEHAFGTVTISTQEEDVWGPWVQSQSVEEDPT